MDIASLKRKVIVDIVDIVWTSRNLKRKVNIWTL